jgi:hypothetical protein
MNRIHQISKDFFNKTLPSFYPIKIISDNIYIYIYIYLFIKKIKNIIFLNIILFNNTSK